MWYSYDKFGYIRKFISSRINYAVMISISIIYIPLGNIWYISGMYETKYVIEKYKQLLVSPQIPIKGKQFKLG